MHANARAGLVALATSIAMGCGGSSMSTSTTPGFYILISNLAYSPVNLQAPPGATVTVINADSTAHSVTSEATPGAFTPGSVAGVSFDTGAFTGGQRSFTLPANAPNGTAVPYYCTVHLGTMTPPNGTITINASAQPAPPPGGGGGGGY